MKSSLRAAASIALITSGLSNALPASAEITETSPGRFACDTPAGRYEQTDIARFANGGAITGRFRFLAGTNDRTRMPTAGYIFRFHTGEVIEVHVGANPRYRHQLVVEIGVPEAGSRPVARVPRGEPVEVTAGVANGTLTVIAGRESRAIPIGARRVVALEASCQSGRFELELQSPPSN